MKILQFSWQFYCMPIGLELVHVNIAAVKLAVNPRQLRRPGNNP